MKFKFEMTTKRTRTDADVMAGLRAYAKKVGYRWFPTTEFDAWKDKPFRSSLAIYRFRSWRRALKLIEVKQPYRSKYLPEELVANLERVWRKVGRAPSARQLQKHGTIGTAPYIRCWGSLGRACEMVAAFHAGKVNKERLLAPLTVEEWRALPSRRVMRNTVRWAVMERDGHRCVSCGRSPASEPDVKLEVDHIVPVSKGGRDEESNLRTLCQECNAGKSDSMDVKRRKKKR